MFVFIYFLILALKKVLVCEIYTARVLSLCFFRCFYAFSCFLYLFFVLGIFLKVCEVSNGISLGFCGEMLVKSY